MSAVYSSPSIYHVPKTIRFSMAYYTFSGETLPENH
jgi:hypothetical protein